MIELKQSETIDEWCGFTVYDAKTGEPIDLAGSHPEDAFVIDQNGVLYAIEDGWIRHWDSVDGKECREVAAVPKEGKYIIQFADGKYMRW